MKMRIARMAIPQLGELSTYPAGKSIEELQGELGLKDVIKMASNENPLGPSPFALKALEASLGQIYRYPDGNCYELKRKLASRFNLKMENFVIGNGSNEIIELVVRTFLKPGDELIVGDPSFIVYKTITKLAGGKLVVVPLKDFSYDIKSIIDAITGNTKIIFIGNPNNPTGTIVKKEELDFLINMLPEDVLCVLDEAYREFVQDKDYPGELDYVFSGKPVLVLRTFSKAYGLAGLRIGYGIGVGAIVDYLNRARQPFNVNYAAQVAATAALDDTEHLRKTIENNMKGMEFIVKNMTRLGLPVVNSHANFLLIKMPVDGMIIYEKLLKRGIITRSMTGYSLRDYVRVTIGSPEENRRFVAELESVLRELS